MQPPYRSLLDTPTPDGPLTSRIHPSRNPNDSPSPLPSPEVVITTSRSIPYKRICLEESSKLDADPFAESTVCITELGQLAIKVGNTDSDI